MEQSDFFENEVIEELLRERNNYFFSKNFLVDFWISLDTEKLIKNDAFNNIKYSLYYLNNKNKFNNKNIKYVLLISQNFEFINWLKLRIGYFEDIINIKKDIKKNNYTSNGLYGETLLLENNKNLLNYELLINQYKNSLNFLNK